MQHQPSASPSAAAQPPEADWQDWRQQVETGKETAGSHSSWQGTGLNNARSWKELLTNERRGGPCFSHEQGTLK